MNGRCYIPHIFGESALNDVSRQKHTKAFAGMSIMFDQRIDGAEHRRSHVVAGGVVHVALAIAPLSNHTV